MLPPLTTLATSAGTVETPPATPAARGSRRKLVLAGAAAVALVIGLGGVLARRRSLSLSGEPLPRARALLPTSSPAPPTAPFDERAPPEKVVAPVVPAVVAPRELEGAQPAPRNEEPPASARPRRTAAKPRGGRGGSGSVAGGRQAWSSATASGPAAPAPAVPASAPGEAASSPAAPAPPAPAKVKKW
jgi:hypothetical protein